MRFEQFAHVVGAAANVVGEDEIVVVGSQAVLGTHRDAPGPLLRSMEADVYPRKSPEKAEAIDGALGDGSQFHRTFGYYAHGVGPETAKAPRGWEERLVRVAIGRRPSSRHRPVALCLAMTDLMLAKCVAGREQDWDFVREALHAGLVDLRHLERAVPDLPVDAAVKERVRRMLDALGTGGNAYDDL